MGASLSAMNDEMDRLSDTVDEALELLRPASPEYADLDFPQVVVDDLLEAGGLSDVVLTRRIVAAAYALAARTGTGTPGKVLGDALGKVASEEKWLDDVAPRVRRLWHRAGLTGEDEAA